MCGCIDTVDMPDVFLNMLYSLDIEMILLPWRLMNIVNMNY